MVDEGKLVALVIANAVLVVEDHAFAERIAHLRVKQQRVTIPARIAVAGQIQASVQTLVQDKRTIVLAFQVQQEFEVEPVLGNVDPILLPAFSNEIEVSFALDAGLFLLHVDLKKWADLGRCPGLPIPVKANGMLVTIFKSERS